MKYFKKRRITSSALIGSFFSQLIAVPFAVLTLIGTVSAAELSLRPAPHAYNYTPCNDYVLSCENGHHYQFCPRAISEEGDIVTGVLIVGRYHPIHMRLIPMGAGYRYAGRGVWLDGIENNAVLNFGNHHSVACSIVAPYGNRFSGYGNRFSYVD
jgi:hypothetical protein